MLDPIDATQATNVLSEYSVGSLLELEPGGGTANANARLRTQTGDFFLRRRNPRYSAHEVVAYDHALMEHLQRGRVATPRPVVGNNGRTWLEHAGSIYELFPFVHGTPHCPNSMAQLRESGLALARLHRGTAGFSHSGKEWPRYRNPADIRNGLGQLGDALGRILSPDDLAYLESQTAKLESGFTDPIYWQLPLTVVHGDWHPGNLLFDGDRPCGIFDLDWATSQPRLLDLADGLFLFCGERSKPFDPTDIRSLTQSWIPSPTRWRHFLEGYQEVSALTDLEWDFLIPMVRARWLTCRFLGRSKLPEAEAADFVADGLVAPLRLLDSIDQTEWTQE